MFNRKDFSLPPKLIALLALIILGGLAIFLSYNFVYGTLTFTSEQTFINVTRQGDSGVHPLPYSYRLKPGKYIFTFGGPSYIEQESQYLIYPFRQRHVAIKLDRSPDVTKFSLLDQLPHFETGSFEVSYPDEHGTYTITLQSHSNWYDSDAEYTKALKSDKQNALNWIRSQKVDPAKLTINWVPYDPDTK